MFSTDLRLRWPFPENFRCWDSEWEIPVGKTGGKLNYEVIQRAWYVLLAAAPSHVD